MAVMPTKKRGGVGGGDDDDLPNKNRKEDPLLLDAIYTAVCQQKVSTSSLQRHLGVGYSRGAKLIDTMEDLGIVSPQNGSKARDVLMTMDDYMRWKQDQDLD
jgi:S-DNA-T family DNA segregation ATPase FtsK/SpoIIIE